MYKITYDFDHYFFTKLSLSFCPLLVEKPDPDPKWIRGIPDPVSQERFRLRLAAYIPLQCRIQALFFIGWWRPNQRWLLLRHILVELWRRCSGHHRRPVHVAVVRWWPTIAVVMVVAVVD
jgi:hypothetical protein